MRFERLDQAPLLFGVEVALDGFGARGAMHAALAARALRLFEVEHRSAGRTLFATKRKAGELDFSAGLEQCHRAVRGAEIDTDKDLLLPA